MELTQKQKETLKRNNAESNFVTRESAQDALFFLMNEQDYEEIRITDIIRKSGISRSAYYRNYKTKDDVLRDSVGDITALVIHTFTTDVEENWRRYIRTIRQNRRKLELLVQAHREWFLLDEFNKLTDYSTGMDFSTVIPHGYIYNIIIYWVKCGLPGNDEEVVSRIMQACRENAVVMLSGVIPQDSMQKTLSHFKSGNA
jgi:AcrR family transcriptional regulator